MNFDTYTERAQSVLQAAQTAALANSNQLFLPEHILKAMLEDRDQLAILRDLLHQAVDGGVGAGVLLSRNFDPA